MVNIIAALTSKPALIIYKAVGLTLTGIATVGEFKNKFDQSKLINATINEQVAKAVAKEMAKQAEKTTEV